MFKYDMCISHCSFVNLLLGSTADNAKACTWAVSAVQWHI